MYAGIHLTFKYILRILTTFTSFRDKCTTFLISHTGRVRNPEAEFLDGDKSLKNFPPCHPQSSPLITDFTPSSMGKSGLKLVCNVNIVYGNLTSEDSQRLCPEISTKFCVHKFGFSTIFAHHTEHIFDS